MITLHSLNLIGGARNHSNQRGKTEKPYSRESIKRNTYAKIRN